MANKYLVGSGSFTSTSIWSDSYDGASGADVPVGGDIIYVDNNYNITSGLPSGSDFDFIVYLGANTSSGLTFGLSGSPTFRLLDIRSANSAAHTVIFDDDVMMDVSKLVIVGSSAANRLTLTNVSLGAYGQFRFASDGSCYGQNVNMLAADMYDYSTPGYIGSTSVNTFGLKWLLQDPPKVSTLVDPLTTAPASNTNWTFPYAYPSQVTTGHYGGGYDLTGGEQMISVETFDLVDTYYVLEQEIVTGSPYTRLLVESGGSSTISVSADGSSWTDVILFSADPVLFRSVRLGAPNLDEMTLPPIMGYVIGSINPELAVDIDANSASSSVSISTPSISRTASLSVQGHGVSTSMSTPDIQSVIVLDTDSVGTSTSMSEPSMVLIKGVLPNSMSIGVSANNLGLLLKAGVLPDNMEIVTTSSIPSISGNILIFTDDMLVGLNEDEVSVAVLRNMDVDVMSIMSAILATAVQIGYPTSDISADNIYAIGSMSEGEYGIATINNNQIYEVVEQDGI